MRNRAFNLTKRKRVVLCTASLFLIVFLICSYFIAQDAQDKYQDQISVVVLDRHNLPLSVSENSKGHYVLMITELPDDFRDLLLKKEDRFFTVHPGINPLSTLRAVGTYLSHGRTNGASTITQQLAKNLLNHETDRTFKNKFMETMYALGMEVFLSKEEILHMYANTVYLGNQIQGFETASFAYFNKPLNDTTTNEQLALLATLSYPSTRNPWEPENEAYASGLSGRLLPENSFYTPTVTGNYRFQTDPYFELRTAGLACDASCQTTVDSVLTENVRSIINRHIDAGWSRNLRNAAVVIIDPQTEEVLSLIGSPDPNSDAHGNQINMAVAPRPIGSTVKPFIYAKGFAAGLRPYTLVEDREYKYPIATGFSLYPKNYDGQYRGTITLHEALSNSLNVPSVKTLEYIGLEDFYRFLDEDLRFSPIQPYDSYQYGIALGGLEMDLLTLTHYFTLFPRGGTLAPLQILEDHSENFDLPPQSAITSERRVVEEPYVALVHAIISDRFTGVNQFGLESNLNLNITNYGVKTGTSRDFHDSWVVGYTPDLVVGVWVGNSENEALAQVSGQSGAGAIWHDVMEYLLTTPYYTDTPVATTHLQRFSIAGSDEWGLMDDTIEEHRELLREDNLILSLHGDDTFALLEELTIPLTARREVTWSINGTALTRAAKTTFSPTDVGSYEISAYDETTDRTEYVTIHVRRQE